LGSEILSADSILARQLDRAEDPDLAAARPSLHQDSIPRARPLGTGLPGAHQGSEVDEIAATHLYLMENRFVTGTV
jgi:hypothetical protein